MRHGAAAEAVRLSAASGPCLLVDNSTWDVTSGFLRKAVSSVPVCSDVLAAGSTATGKSWKLAACVAAKKGIKSAFFFF